MEVEIGIGKSGRRAYGFDDIAIVPSRRTRDPEDVDITWELDAFKFELPVMGSAMDGALSPRTAIEMGHLGGVGCLNLEGLWTPYDDPDVLKAQPFFALLKTAFEGAVARPSAVTGERYNEVSTLFWNAVHNTLSKQGDGATNLAQLQKDLNRLSRGGRW